MATKLSQPASAPPSSFAPYVSPHDAPAELTFRALFLGSVLGVIFAASSVYLALKIGLTVSRSEERRVGKECRL